MTGVGVVIYAVCQVLSGCLRPMRVHKRPEALMTDNHHACIWTNPCLQPPRAGSQLAAATTCWNCLVSRSCSCHVAPCHTRRCGRTGFVLRRGRCLCSTCRCDACAVLRAGRRIILTYCVCHVFEACKCRTGPQNIDLTPDCSKYRPDRP